MALPTHHSENSSSPASSSSCDVSRSSSSSSMSSAGAVAVAAGAAVAASGLTLFALAGLRRLRRLRQQQLRVAAMVPLVEQCEAGKKVARIERFGEYVVRQVGIPPDLTAASLLAQAADDYIKGDKSKADKSRDNLLALAASACSADGVAEDREGGEGDARANKLAMQLIRELDACMYAYFAFHWDHSAMLIEQVFRGPKVKLKLKDVVLTVTRQQRFKRIVEELRPAQKLTLLLEELKLLGKNVSASSSPTTSPSLTPSSSSASVLVPAQPEERPPVLLLIGGGMGAGKSTVVREIMKRCFWARSAQNAVVVEADAFKEKDVIFRALSSDALADMAQVAQLVHEESTKAASSTLVTALNEGRDVIFDGTMSWAPFVRQTIAMARDVHRRRYRLGPGYQERADGSVEEQYWEAVEESVDGDGEWERHRQHLDGESGKGGKRGEREQLRDDIFKALRQARRPYRVELVGVVCDVHLAVVRGMRRAILTKRGVPVSAQLRSHALFAQSVEGYCNLVDNATIYSTNRIGQPPQLIAYKEGGGPLLVDPASFGVLLSLKNVNCAAQNALELYPACPSTLALGWRFFGPGSTWKDTVLSQERPQRQQGLKNALTHLQACLWRNSRANHGVTSSTSFAAASSD